MRADFRNMVEGILATLAENTRLTKTAAHKLCYLIDVAAIQDTGKPLLGLNFRHTDHGMWSPRLAGILRRAVERGILQSRPVRADVGEGAVFQMSPDLQIELPESVEKLVNKVLEGHGQLSLTGLIAKAKATSPFIYSEEGEWVDWEMAIEEYCEEEHVLTPETVAQIEGARKELQEGKGLRYGMKEALKELD